jgi:hypothetical protein
MSPPWREIHYSTNEAETTDLVLQNVDLSQ